MSETIVPFKDAAAKRAANPSLDNGPFKDAAAKRAANPSLDNGDPDISAVENILHALEGMQAQVQALTVLVVEQDKRISNLEKAARGGKIIQVRN